MISFCWGTEEQTRIAYFNTNIFVIKKQIVCKNICHQEINIDDFLFAEAPKNRPEWLTWTPKYLLSRKWIQTNICYQEIGIYHSFLLRHWIAYLQGHARTMVWRINHRNFWLSRDKNRRTVWCKEIELSLTYETMFWRTLVVCAELFWERWYLGRCHPAPAHWHDTSIRLWCERMWVLDSFSWRNNQT